MVQYDRINSVQICTDHKNLGKGGGGVSQILCSVCVEKLCVPVFLCIMKSTHFSLLALVGINRGGGKHSPKTKRENSKNSGHYSTH
jgi:hypothetical protein